MIVVGGGFAGLGCVRQLARARDVHVTLLDRNNYHQFQPLLYQVATSQLGTSSIAVSLRKVFHKRRNVDIKMAEVASIDPATCTVTATDGGQLDGRRRGARGRVACRTSSGRPALSSHSFPLYSLNDAQRLRSRIIAVFEAADRDPSLVERGALNFVVVGGGATGVETAGALADMIHWTMTVEYRDLAVTAARVHLVDLGHQLLGPFSSARTSTRAKVLRARVSSSTSAPR